MSTIADNSQSSSFGRSFLDWWKRTTQTRSAYFYFVPAAIVMAMITFYPLFYQVWMSFTDYGITNLRFDAPPPNNVGIQNYLDILPDKLKFFGNEIDIPGTGILSTKVQNFSFMRVLG